ncbi:serine hydroxymethyltransferase [Prochlorococcus marinus]|uniref:Serine hydroxymethyltransferase n=1 Tax=Prochlorococcus marinus XMU1408 TaxID=2213228 RepID=A0A318RH15_PROMR|nr:serine hydroxymethyltransferase [Prochlorococcus marinus]MBW3041902.1 serine hydroxymethyltransferase [Prochlorococcus marinus str. XMU1408]PYE03033.1 serine hydroxymethyltransferase [Prochlorococcus marinus XMU1408]
MEFIQYLDKIEIKIIEHVEKAGYSTEENTSLCLLSQKYVGFLKKRQKKIVICTDNVKRIGGYKSLSKKYTDTYERTATLIKKALRHEAVHVTQECNNGNLLKINKNLTMNPAKIEALKGSTKISGEEEKERQAYILEDKPRLVEKELIKYCL